MKEVAGGIGFGDEDVDQVIGADRMAERRVVIAAVEIPFEVRAMADAEDDIGIGEGRFQQRTESGGISLHAYAEIDVRRDHAREGAFGGCRRQLIRRHGTKGIPEKGQCLGGVGGVTGRVMLGG